MALIFLNKSECAICGKTFKEQECIESLPAVSDTLNPLYSYFDRGFHESCFLHWDKKEEVEHILQKERVQFEKSDYYNEMMAKYGKPKQ